MERIFLLSPARCAGRRSELLYNDRATFDLARQLRAPGGAPLGEIFSFLSGLYFRGKLSYARTFARPRRGAAGVLVITPSEGLRTPEEPLTLGRLQSFAGVPIEARETRYWRPLQADIARLRGRLAPDSEVILLGSIATGKYVDVLMAELGERLRFPAEFVGRGDMSRGGLMLRCVQAQRELEYIPVAGAVRRGGRPPKLGPP